MTLLSLCSLCVLLPAVAEALLVPQPLVVANGAGTRSRCGSPRCCDFDGGPLAEAYWESFLAASRDECTALGLELRSARLDLAKGKLLVQASGGGIDQLQTLSQRMSSYLDAEGDTPDESVAALPPFLLEVTSPGLSDDLEEDRDFETWKGFDVSVGTTEVYKKKTVFEGTLHGRDETHVRVNQKGRIVKIPRELVDYVRLPKPMFEKGDPSS